MGQSLESPFMSVIEEGMELDPAGSDIGGGEGMEVLAYSSLTAMVNGVYLPETGLFSFFGGIEGADGDATFQGKHGFGEAFPFEPETFLVFFQAAVYGGRTYRFEFFRNFL